MGGKEDGVSLVFHEKGPGKRFPLTRWLGQSCLEESLENERFLLQLWGYQCKQTGADWEVLKRRSL